MPEITWEGKFTEITTYLYERFWGLKKPENIFKSGAKMPHFEKRTYISLVEQVGIYTFEFFLTRNPEV